MGLLDIVIKDFISPGKGFYYKIKMPIGLNPSAFGSEIAFFNHSNILLYHNSKAYAHEINTPDEVAIPRAMAMGELPNYIPPIRTGPIVRLAT